jgi:hypothetical protein
MTQQQQLYNQWKAYYQASGYDPVAAHAMAMKAVYPHGQPTVATPRPTVTQAQPPPNTITTVPQQKSYAQAAKPKFIPVRPARPVQTPKPQPVQKSPPKTDEKYPPAFVQYLERVFESVPKEKQKEMELKLKELVNRIQDSGAMWTTDWSLMKIPELSQDSVFSSDQSTDVNMEKQTPNSVDISKRLGKKRKMNVNDNTPSKLTANTESSSFTMFSSNDPESVKREERAKRFHFEIEEREREEREKKRKNELAKIQFLKLGKDNKDIIDWDEHTVVGTCQNLEKRYLRLTDVPFIHSYLLRHLIHLQSDHYMFSRNPSIF